MEHNEIREKIGTFKGYHAIQFSDDILTPGRFSSKIPPNYTIFPVFYFLENMNLRYPSKRSEHLFPPYNECLGWVDAVL